jgi:hypothetical protein
MALGDKGSPGDKGRPLSPGDFKHRSNLTEAELLEQLRKETPEVDVRQEQGFTKSLVDAVARALKRSERPDQDDRPARGDPTMTLSMLKRRADLKGLPFIDGPGCQLRDLQAKQLQQVSLSIRDSVEHIFSKRDEPLTLRNRIEDEEGVVKALNSAVRLYSKARLPIFVQAFVPQGPKVRLRLVELLAGWRAEETSRLLAQRAIFDLSADVRAKAIEALKKRRRADYRDVLLKALRYPWAPAADHATEALVALDDRAALPELVELLDLPDPRTPYRNKDKQWVVHELVRINHLRNCLLCHAASASEADLARAFSPSVEKPLPPTGYYDGIGEFVRADITYLKQDFSVFHAAAHPDPWPKVQRFDYLVRLRELSDDERTKRGLKVSEEGQALAKTAEVKSFPQRDAVLFALRELHGRDAGTTSAAWRKELGKAPPEDRVRAPEGRR